MLFIFSGHNQHPPQRHHGGHRAGGAGADDLGAARAVPRPVRRHPATQGRPLLPAQAGQAHLGKVPTHYKSISLIYSLCFLCIKN